MALKDIKNYLSLNAGLHVPGGTCKGQITDSECKTSVPNKRAVTGSIKLGNFYSSGQQATANACYEITNGLENCFLPILDEHSARKFESLKHKELKGKKERNMVPTVTSKETPASVNVMQLSPEYHSMSAFFFTDSAPEQFLNCMNKPFSTPMPSNGRHGKKLSPIIEVESEATALQELQSTDKIFTVDVQKCPCGEDAPLYDSPTHSPLYRSFFANECQEIAKKIASSESAFHLPGLLLKSKELDVSSIDAEPPPYYCTPMKSMLACDVANISSLESSPVRDGASLFGVSLLDLEKTDMQFEHLDLSCCGNKNPPKQYLNDSLVKGFYLEDKLDGVSFTNGQKMGSMSCDRVFHFDHVQSAANHEVHGVASKQIRSISDGTNVSQVLELNPNHEQTPLTEKYLNKFGSTTPENHDILPASNNLEHLAKSILDIDFPTNVIPYHKVPATNTIELIELLPQTLENITQDIVLMNKELSIANTTAVIEDPSQTCTNIQNKDSVQETNTTWVMDKIPETCSTVQKACPENWVNPANTIQVIEQIPPSANTIQDRSSTNEYLGEANITQVIGMMQQSADITQEIVQSHEEVSAPSTAQVMGAVPQSNIAQDILSTQKEISAVNTTHIMEIGLQSGTTTQDIESPSEEVNAGNTTQVIEVILQSSVGTCEMASAYKPKAVKLVSENLIHDIVLVNKGKERDLHPNAAVISGDIDVVATGNTTNDALLGASGLNDGSAGDTHMLNIQPQSLSSAVPQTISIPHNTLFSANNVSSASQALDIPKEMQVTCLSLNKVMNIRTTKLAASSVTENNNISVKDYSGYSLTLTKEIVPLNKTDDMQALDADGKKRKDHFLMSESCSTIQEEENIHDVSVFSVGSLSFVTSTPVPGVTDFQFQKACKDSEHQDRNQCVDVGLSQRNTLLDRCVVEQTSDVNKKTEVSLLPTIKGRTMLPPQTSSIPSARRSLALQNPLVQVSTKGTMTSETLPKGIPGRGMIRPPVARQSLPRATVDNLKQIVEDPSGIMTSNKLVSHIRNPKVTAEKIICPAERTQPKARSTTSPQLLPTPLVKPPSRSTGNSGRLSVRIPNATNRLQEPSCGETSSVRPVGVRTRILKPGRLSLRPPLPSNTQKTAPKSNTVKSNLPAEESESEGCRHLETCKYCNARHLLLLQETEDLKRQTGQVQHGKKDMSAKA